MKLSNKLVFIVQYFPKFTNEKLGKKILSVLREYKALLFIL